MGQRYASFAEFYPFYLSEHRNRTCRRLHFAGSLLVLGLLVSALITRVWWLLLLMPVAGYGLAWVGHFVFEKNRPATFTYPLYPQSRDGSRTGGASFHKSYGFHESLHHLPRDWGHSSRRRRMRQGWGEAPRALPVERGGTRKANRAFRLASPAEREREGPLPVWEKKPFPRKAPAAPKVRPIHRGIWAIRGCMQCQREGP